MGILRTVSAVLLAGSLGGCAYFYAKPPATVYGAGHSQTSRYVIGSGDQLQILVWQNAELTLTTTVRPDGKISVPLLQDVQAEGVTPEELGAQITTGLKRYIHEPQVTVIVQNSAGKSMTNVRVIGDAVQPKVVPYYVGMTLMDVMAEAGGLTDYADGNRAFLVRSVEGKSTRYHLRIASLLKSGDMSANVELAPGDTIVIPERWY